MHWIKNIIAYYGYNPEGYWFRRKLYGWGWTPVKWQCWLVVASGITIAMAGIYLGDIDDAPGAACLGLIVAIFLIGFFGYWKGEKPRWQWGVPKDQE